MIRRNVLGESEMNGTRCGRYIWDQDGYWCIQLINSVDQTCHWGLVGGKATSMWTVALQMSYMYVHRCSLRPQCAIHLHIFLSFLPICLSLSQSHKSICLLSLYLLNQPSLQSSCLFLLIMLPQLHRMPICSHFLFSPPPLSLSLSLSLFPSLLLRGAEYWFSI